MPELPRYLRDKLAKREQDGGLRNLVDFSHKIDFFSNDYLGFADVEFEKTTFNKEGSTGSRLISGNTKFAERVEAELAEFFNFEAGLIFNSGFDANLGILSSIPQRGDTIVYDELCHASIRDGIRLSFAEKNAFRHNDLDHLRQKLKAAKGQKYVVVEGIYSMDGDIAPLKEIAETCKEHEALLILDEAHAAGILGNNGKGLSDLINCDDSIFIKLVTFGKAFGCHGAVALSGEKTREYLLNFARSFIYTTALPPSSVFRIQQSMKAIDLAQERRELLLANINFFETTAKRLIGNYEFNQTPIQTIFINDRDSLMRKVKAANDANYALKAILHPTVPKDKERVRICLHSFNTKEEIEGLLKTLFV